MPVFVTLLTACAATSTPPPDLGADGAVAVQQVTASGTDEAYTFAVTLASEETGCDAYADWWEVVSEDGALLYRRVLGHSHPDEQPFTRTGGPVPIAADTKVYIRGHHNPAGYGSQAFFGSVNDGFSAATLAEDWSADLAGLSPLPDGCAF